MEETKPASRSGVWSRGLDWLEANLAQFGMPAGEPEILRLKALGELARAADLICRQSSAPPAALDRAQRLLRFAWREFGEGSVFARVLATRPMVVLGTMYSIFARHGLVHGETQERLAALGRPGALAAKALTPRTGEGDEPIARYGKDGVFVLGLGLGLAWDSLGLASPWSRDRLFPRTRLGQRLDGESIADADAYSLTHAVFFMTDFGARPGDLDADSRAYLCRRVPGWLHAYRAGGHHDLYAELALCLACIDALGSGAGEIESALRASQRSDGSLPGAGGRFRSRIEGEPDPERRQFLQSYHSTLTGVMASFAAGVGLARRAGA